MDKGIINAPNTIGVKITDIKRTVLDSINDYNKIDLINYRTIKTELYPVIKTNEKFNLNEAKKIVKSYLSNLMILTEKEEEFLVRIENKKYIPELLFNELEIINRIKSHPIAFWKAK